MSHRNFRLSVTLIGLTFLTAIAASPASANSRYRDFDGHRRSDSGYNFHRHRSDGWYDSHGSFHRYERHERSY